MAARCQRHSFSKIVRPAHGHQGRRGSSPARCRVGDRARRPESPGQWRSSCSAIAARQIFRPRDGHAEIVRRERTPVNLSMPDFECQCGTGGRDFIQTVGAMHHKPALQSQRSQRARDQLRVMRAGRAGDLRAGARRIGQRARAD